MKTILCYGDSNTWGFIPESITEAFPDAIPVMCGGTGVLQRELGSEFQVIEEGQNGRTTVHDDPVNLHRNGRAYLPACLEPQKPLNLVILMLGTNDLKAMFGVSPGEIAAGAGQLGKMILQSDTGPLAQAPKLLLVCPPAVGHMPHLPDVAEKLEGGQLKSKRLPASYEAVARQLGCAFLNSQDIVQPSATDGIHLEANDHEKLGKAIAEAVKRILP